MATKTEECNDSKEFDAFFEEVKDIEKNTGAHEPDLQGSDEELSKLPDEGEEELSWLKDAGLEHLAKPLEEGTLLDDEDVSCGTAGLTEEQVAVVKKRVDTLNATIRKKQKGYQPKHSNKVDVRAVFSTPLPQRESCPQGGSTGTSETTPRSEVCSMPATSACNRVVLRRKGRENIARDRTTFLQDLDHGTPLLESPVARAPGVSALMHRESDVSMSFTIDQPISPRPAPKKGTKELPYYKDSKDTLGVTKVDQMSEKDRCMIRKLALIELTSLYEVHNIKYTRRKPKRRYKDNSVFGVPLQTLLDNDRKRHPEKHIKVPLIFSQLIQFLTKFALEEEGILRVPGSVTRIKSIREEIEDRFNSGKFSWDDMRPNDVAGLFKQFLRELPIPLLTFEYIDAFAQVGTIPDHKQQLTALILLVLLLPDVHRDTLKMLLGFLKLITQRSETRMDLNSVSMIMAPNLFLVQSGRHNKDLGGLQLSMAAGTSSIVRMLIKNQAIYWTVPPFMVQQIRHKNEMPQITKKPQKMRIKFLGRKDKSENSYRLPLARGQHDANVIHVEAPHLHKINTAIQLDPDTTADDIVARFMPSVPEVNGSAANGDEDEGDAESKDRIHLFEVGGNIGERQLDPRTKMLDLYSVNPHAKWVVRAGQPH